MPSLNLVSVNVDDYIMTLQAQIEKLLYVMKQKR